MWLLLRAVSVPFDRAHTPAAPDFSTVSDDTSERLGESLAGIFFTTTSNTQYLLHPA